MNFTKEQVVVASSINPFDNFYDDLQQIYDLKILHHLSSALNLNVTFLETPLITNLQNYKKEPDLWILEQIVNGSAQISSTTIIITNETSNALRSLRDENYIYWAPFSIHVWFCILFLCLTLTLVLTFILRRESKLPHKISYDIFARLIDVQEDGDENKYGELPKTSEESLHQREKWEMSEILLVCLGAFCQQGSARDPSTHAARIILLVFFLLAAISYTAYSASIISYISFLPSIEKENVLNKENFIRENNLVLHRTRKIKNILQFFNGAFNYEIDHFRFTFKM
ncbi:hypothetical protein Phum_PHUM505040 [Pediculus humanus corporis]|uniref:Ionotropic glutamate receptor C-terminal domain-containing protein n=1 Tax=Pediculus humanus subsp. corporis TaxID=121224 RepID=E0VXV3_PEDHC|nr:uncharacterized protein Phum_PHUM505040 [Pediculus humanus corporis]EEB18209.1 hypothetical protein Phum_PHUM505040 [Pediculus humanus corporis]